MIGANAVVIHDLPAGTTAVGVPTLQIQRKNSHGESCNAV
jgi:serine acetyltransferase